MARPGRWLSPAKATPASVSGTPARVRTVASALSPALARRPDRGPGRVMVGLRITAAGSTS